MTGDALAASDLFWRRFMRMWSLFARPTDAEWAADWYRDPGSAWWES